MNSIYGVGALSSPVLASLLMQANFAPPLFYFSNFAWCVASVTALLFGFGLSPAALTPNNQLEVTQEAQEDIASLGTVIRSRAVRAPLLFIGLYTGTETGESGWIVSLLMRERSGGSTAGYASAAFYAGLTASRVLLLPLTAFVGEKLAVALYASVALAMQVIIWTSSSFAVDFAAVAVCGFMMGPVYPITIELLVKATPMHYHPGALGLMACAAQSGSAMFPFVVGSLADRFGIMVLQPVLVTLFALQILVWQLVPSGKVEDHAPLLEAEDPGVLSFTA